MSTLVENVEKVKNAHAALKLAIESKGVPVPAGTKLTGMPALVDQIQTGGSVEPTNDRAVFAYDDSTSLVVPNTLVVDLISATNLRYLFYNCNNLTSLTLPDGFGQNATDISYCFATCYNIDSLTLPNGFGQNATNLQGCFNDCGGNYGHLNALTLPDGFGQNATDISYCFAGSRIVTLTLPDGFGQNATDISYCFNNCINTIRLTLPNGFGQNATNTECCFYGCIYLTDITGNPNFKVSLDLSPCPLTHDSIMVVINGLQTVTETQTLTLGSTNLAQLTDEEKQIATDKGWTLA